MLIRVLASDFELLLGDSTGEEKGLPTALPHLLSSTAQSNTGE